MQSCERCADAELLLCLPCALCASCIPSVTSMCVVLSCTRLLHSLGACVSAGRVGNL